MPALFRRLAGVREAERITVDRYVLSTPKGDLMAANKGDWIVKTSDGSLFVLSDNLFRGSYEPANDEAAGLWNRESP